MKKHDRPPQELARKPAPVHHPADQTTAPSPEPSVVIPDTLRSAPVRQKHGKPIERPQKIWRHEDKYLLDEYSFTRLYWQLRPFVGLDRHAETDGWLGDPAGLDEIPGLATDAQYPGYQVKSLYFDTIGRHGLFEKLAGIDQRFKYRVRIYNNGDHVIHLEKKMKRNQYCLKSSIPISRSQLDALLAGDAEWLLEAGPPGTDLYTEMRTRLMKPLVLVDYHRIPLIWPADEIRITFDSHLSTGLFRTDLFEEHAAMHPVLSPGQVILEVKYNHFLPDFLNALLSQSGAMPVSLSKYAMCCREISFASWSDPQDTLDD